MSKGIAYPDNNPKAAMGATKAPLHLVPPALMIGAAEAMADGARKYGPYNFRDSGIAASVYMGAIERHLFSWWDGEDMTRDSKIHHLKAIAADVGLMLDAMAKGTFVDDRPTSGGAADLLQDWEDRIGRSNSLRSHDVTRGGVAGQCAASPQPAEELQAKSLGPYHSGGYCIPIGDLEHASNIVRGYDIRTAGARRQVLD